MKRLLIILLFLSQGVMGLTSSEVSENINSLMNKINHLNQDLQQKQQQQKKLDNAINDSNAAISESEKILRQLKSQRDLDRTQLNEIADALPGIESTTLVIQKNVRKAIAIIYQQTLQLSNDSSLPGNDTLNDKRKQKYLLALLKIETTKYQQLQAKLDQLSSLNNKLQQEVARLNNQLDATAQKQQQLLLAKHAKMNQIQELNAQIVFEQKQLVGLSQKQAELNRLLIALGRDANETSTTTANSTKLAIPDAINNDSNDSFFRRKLAKPLKTKVIVPYGALRHRVRNNGVLYEGNNNAVFSISSGVVMYSSNLPGFGTVIVINHGNNYMSIYGGVLPNVKKGQAVTTGEVIANSGVAANQPMGGVYFELRHLGQPINPGELAN
ncbi:MAG: peptidoglycan DD-metalloendopeptidase family protein [Burkholderiales bacterium]|nr:peptidoglycan DD-metalloendopeptidase family protein [Burkholderiales bacterium]